MGFDERKLDVPEFYVLFNQQDVFTQQNLMIYRFTMM